MRRVITSSILTVLACAVSLCNAIGDERSAALDRQATGLYQQVLSPFCPGRSLNDCPSSKAEELKNEMRVQLEQGRAPEEILNGVFARFGEQYRAVPRFAGVGILVWAVPALFVVFGIFMVLRMCRGGKR